MSRKKSPKMAKKISHRLEEFQQRLIRQLKLKGLSAHAVNEKCKFGPNTVNRWKNGEGFPRSPELVKVCEVLECTPNELLGFEALSVDNRIKRCINRLQRLRAWYEVEINHILSELTGGVNFRIDREKAIEIVESWGKLSIDIDNHSGHDGDGKSYSDDNPGRTE